MPDLIENTQVKKTVDKTEKIDNRIKIGRVKREGKTPISVIIPEASRKANTLILGSKLSGKSTFVLPYLAKQDITRKNAGCTFVVSKKDLAYTLYAIAKIETKKKVHLIKPSCDLGIANELLTDYSFTYVKDQLNDIINFKEVIKKKEIVIIDMENSKYHQDAIRAVAKLLIQLQVDMQDVISTIKRDHFVYIDDAQYYLPFIDTLLNYGDDYNVSTTLFMQSRNQFQMYDEDYTQLIDNNVRNYILMNGINFEDAVYFAPFFGVDANKFLQRKTGTLSVAYVDHQGSTKFVPECDVLKISDAEMKKIEERAKKERKKLVKTSNSDERKIVLSNSERRGLNALAPEEIIGKKQEQNKMPSENVVDKTDNVINDGATNIPVKETSIPENNDDKEESFSDVLNDFDAVIPDIGLEDEETYMPDDFELEAPEYLEVEDIEDIHEEVPVVDEPKEEVPIFENRKDDIQIKEDDDEEIILAENAINAYERANLRIRNKRSFAPKRRTEIEGASVEEFYTKVLGDKFGR